MSSCVGGDYDEVLLVPAYCWLDPGFLEPAQLIGDRARLVVRRADRRDDVVRIVGDDDVGEDEAPARAQPAAHPAEQIRFPGRVQVMDRERRDDQIVGPLGKRVFKSLDPQVCGREAVTGPGEHPLALINPDEAGSLAHRQHRRWRFFWCHPKLTKYSALEAIVAA